MTEIPGATWKAACEIFDKLHKHPNARAILAEALAAAEQRGAERERERCGMLAEDAAAIREKQSFDATDRTKRMALSAQAFVLSGLAAAIRKGDGR